MTTLSERQRLSLRHTTPTGTEAARRPGLLTLWSFLTFVVLSVSLGTVWGQDQPPPALQPGSSQRMPGGSGNPIEFDLNLADNLGFLWLAGAFVVAVFGAIIHYRARLEPLIREGVHPDHLRLTTYVFWLGVFLLLSFLVLWAADIGIHLIMLAVFVVAMLAVLVTGRLLWQPILLVLVCIIALGAYRYWGTLG